MKDMKLMKKRIEREKAEVRDEGYLM